MNHLCSRLFHWPADKLWGDLANDPGGGAPALLSESSCIMGQRWWSRGAVVGSAAPVSELSSVEGAATGGAAGEAVLLWGANTVCGRRGGGTPRRRAATWTTRMLAGSLNVLQLVCQHYGFCHKETSTSHSYSRWRHADRAAHLALSSVLSSMGGSVLFEGCPDDDMDLVWRGRVELIAVDGVLPDTSVKLRIKMQIFFQNQLISMQRFIGCALKCLEHD